MHQPEETIAGKFISSIEGQLQARIDKKKEQRRARYKIKRQNPQFVEKEKKRLREYARTEKARSRTMPYKKEWVRRMSPERKAVYNKQQIKWRDSSYERLKKDPARKANLRTNSNRYVRDRRKRDPEFLLKSRIRDQFRCCIRKGWAAKSISAWRLCGCSLQELKAHIESQFTGGMSWENYGAGPDRWCIDHKRPLASFNLMDFEQQKLAFNWANLQPMWFLENCEKSSCMDGVRIFKKSSMESVNIIVADSALSVKVPA